MGRAAALWARTTLSERLALCATVALATGAVLDLDRLVSLRELSRRAGPGQRLAMIGSAVLLASLFLPWITLGAGAACALGVFLAVAGSYLAAGQVALGFETGVGPGIWAAIAASVIVIVGGVIAGRPDVSRRTNTAADDAAMAVGRMSGMDPGR
jgi:hypothetical protein